MPALVKFYEKNSHGDPDPPVLGFMLGTLGIPLT